MGLPQGREARLFYRAAVQRFEDAQLLLEAGRTTGAVYLAGYTVECYMKAMLLAAISGGRRTEILLEFRGSRAHDLEWLGAKYRRETGTTFPKLVVRHLARVASWTTDLRYSTTTIKRREADVFLESVAELSLWAEGRM